MSTMRVASETALPLGVAQSIALHVCETALRYDGRCTWLGLVQDAVEGSTEFEYSMETLPPDVYSGTAGVALFLAEVAAHTGDDSLREIAEGATRQSLVRLESIPSYRRFGFYAGVVGAAWSAARVGWLIGRAEFLARARDVLAPLLNDRGEDALLDVIGGAAGAIPALLSLSRTLDAPELAEGAVGLGDRIVHTASRGDSGWSWDEDATGFETARDLTGFAHGAAGMAWALLELHAATGEPRFLEGAREATRYEDRWFDAERGNWPDFRESDGEDEAPRFALAWCHGAPGIGLARARAAELGMLERDDAYLAAALRSSVAPLQRAEGSFRDRSLCHGGLGVAECVLEMARVTGDAQAAQAARAYALRQGERFGKEPTAWPGGLARGGTPALMLGLAGIGHFFLRLAVPEVPPLLRVSSEPW